MHDGEGAGRPRIRTGTGTILRRLAQRVVWLQPAKRRALSSVLAGAGAGVLGQLGLCARSVCEATAGNGR